MKTATKLIIKFSTLAIAATMSSPVEAYPTATFVKRVGAFAELANTAYCPQIGDISEISIEGKTFERDGDMSTGEIHTYRRVTGNTHHVLINFCGTRTDTLWGIGDVVLDVQGAVIAKKARNPWTGVTSNSRGVGSGFDRRAANFLNPQGGPGRHLKEYLDNRKALGGKTVIHTVGHSLGAAASQISSFYMSEYMRDQNFDSQKFQIYNFAFNAPQSMSQNFQDAFKAEAENSKNYLIPYSFTVKRDAVSTWATDYMRSALDLGNPLRQEFEPMVNKPAAIENHLITDDYIRDRILTESAWSSTALNTMSQKYLPGCW